jgi:hypothetical protein
MCIPLNKPRHNLEDDIEIDLKERGGVRVDEIHLVKDRIQWWLL